MRKEDALTFWKLIQDFADGEAALASNQDPVESLGAAEFRRRKDKVMATEIELKEKFTELTGWRPVWLPPGPKRGWDVVWEGDDDRS